MKNALMSLFCLRELEQSKAGIKTDDLHSRISNAGHIAPVPRTLQRDLNAFRQRGIEIATSRNRHKLTQTRETLLGFMNFLRSMSVESEYSTHFFGDLDTRKAVDYFSGRTDTIMLVYEILDAIVNKKILLFNYAPQTDVTRQRMNGVDCVHASGKKTKAVRLLPRYLVFSGNSFLVLGEYYEKKTLYKNHFAKPKPRHFELRGISRICQGETVRPELDINPHEIYRNSVQVWAGGKDYDLDIEEVWHDHSKPQRQKRKVNGEDEILSLAAGSLGRLRVINPPEELVKRANAIGLPHGLIFRFE